MGQRTGLSIQLIVVMLVIVSGCAGPEPRGAGPAHLNPANVPDPLQSLIPLAEKWGIGDDVERGEALGRATEAERLKLRAAVAAHGAAITAWLDGFASGADMTPEAAAFMYLQLAAEELPQ